MRTIVIYHGGGCADGFCSAWLFSKAFPDAEFIACNYGDPVPEVYNSRVFVLDFSWKRPEMIALIEKAYSVVVLDHHPTAADELCSDPRFKSCGQPPVIIFDMEKSGARLAWDFVRQDLMLDPSRTPDAEMLVGYVEDRDLWRWKLPESREINAALRSYPLEFETWDALCVAVSLASGRAALLMQGGAILRDQAQTIAAHVKNATEILIDGHRVLAVNATTLISEIAGELAKDRPFGVCYFDKGIGTDTPMRIFSARVRDGDFDVSELAKKFGGGGHKKAAGWQVKL